MLNAPAELDFEELLRRFELPLQQYATRIIGDRERARGGPARSVCDL